MRYIENHSIQEKTNSINIVHFIHEVTAAF